MGSILNATDNFDNNIVVPVPGEPIRAGGGVQTPEDITGSGGDINGTVTYTGLVPFVRIRHVNLGNSQTLLATVTGNDISVRLATSNVGVVTSTANAVVAEVLAKAPGLVDAVARGTGAGLAGVKDWVQISAGALGSIYPMELSLANRTIYLKSRVDDIINRFTYTPLHYDVELIALNTTDIFRSAVGAFYALKLPSFTPGFIGGASSYTLTNADLQVAGAYVADTWYYVYFDTSSGAPVDVINTTAPTTRQNYQNGNGYFRYVGAFRTDGSANIKMFRKVGRKTIYLQPVPEYSNDVVSANINGPSPYPLRWVTPGGLKSTFARVRLIISNSDSVTQTFFWTHDINIAQWFGIPISANSTQIQEITVASAAVNSSLNFAAYCSAATKITVTVQTMEFYE